MSNKLKLKIEVELKDDIKDMEFYEICRLANLISALKYTHEHLKVDYDLVVIYAKNLGKFLTNKLKEQLPEDSITDEIIIGDRVPALSFKMNNDFKVQPILIDQLFSKDYIVNPFYLIGLLLELKDAENDIINIEIINKEIDRIVKHFNLIKR